MNESALLPIHTTDDNGNPLYLCACCKKAFPFMSLAQFCAVQDVALWERVPVLR